MKFRPPPILRSRRAALIAVLVISVATHFAFYGTPDTVVFDEVHFGKFVSAYYTGEYYFDIHPPLGKLIIAGVAKVFGFVPSADFETIGGAFSGNSHLYLRLLPTLAGALLAPVIFLLALELGLSVAAAFAAGALIGMDNALLVQSRLVLLDSFLLLFGFSSVLCYLRWRNGGSRWFLPAAGVLAGAAAGIKWTGLSFLAIVGVMELAHLWIDRKGTARKRLHTVALSLVAAPLIVYTASFVVHFALLPKSGPGDAFMSQSFQATLQGSRYAQEGEDWPPINLLSMVVELNAEMFRSNQRLTATHPYSSAWYTWPFMTRPIFYWVGDMSRIYLLGNPVVWYGSTAAVVLALWFLVRRFRREQVLAVLVGAYALNFLPFIGIGRVMFLYHYFTALVFAVLVLA
ncbi:MAG TPA: phospholipid carrier-dependent glycosyltransferase, partial [Candidatus Paceibacterota bacterium]|nr:phospholipid carrier-dependent glycosyltransferase [Candidatus Paceibacterota bacterium]